MKKLLITTLLFASVSAFADFKKEMTPFQVKAEVIAQLAAKVPPVVILRTARGKGYDVTKVLIAEGVDPSDIVESTRSGLDNAEIPFGQSRPAPGSSVGRSFSVSPS